MCGRFAVVTPPAAMRALFAYGEQPNFPARYNIAPTQPIAVVAAEAGQRHFRLMRWGFIPGFVKDEKRFPLIINIRAETVREKPSYRAAFMRRRCLIPVDGFYEWRSVGRDKQPFLIRRADEKTFAFAGLHETWSSPDGSEIDTAALITTDANGFLAALHHRMPAILDEADHAAWLDPATRLDEAEALLRPASDDLLTMRRVGKAVNKATNEGEDLWRSDDLFSV